MSVADQQALDRRMIELDGTPDKRRLGANAIVAVSLACAHADAAVRKLPLWKKLAGERRIALPCRRSRSSAGVLHAGARVDIQDYMIICTGAGSFAEALEWTAQVYAAAGKRPREARRPAGRRRRRRLLAGRSRRTRKGWRARRRDRRCRPRARHRRLDRARHRGQPAFPLGSYQLALEKRALSAEQLHAMLLRWIERYPIVSIEDPFAEHHADALRAFTKAAPESRSSATTSS
jgi:enolase